MMSLWDALRMNMMISYQELVRTFPCSRKRSFPLLFLKQIRGLNELNHYRLVF